MCDYCSWIDRVLAKVYTEVKAQHKNIPERVDPTIIVHGGSGRIPAKKRPYMLTEVKNSAIEAYIELINGRSAVNAVEIAICCMESKKYFNCGYGGSTNANGEVVMDAGIMTANYECGFVGDVHNIEHPITLAKKVLQKTPHVLIVGNGTKIFAEEMDIPIVAAESLVAEETPDESAYSMGTAEGEEEEEEDQNVGRYDPRYYCDDDTCGDWIDTPHHKKKEKKDPKTSFCPSTCAKEKSSPLNYLSSSTSTKSCEGEEGLYDADSSICVPQPEEEPLFLEINGVGAVAYDRKRRLASGTSTAGHLGKLIGNVSAMGTVPGCGVYVNDNGGVSVSGEDKAIYTFAPARKIVHRLANDCIGIAMTAEIRNFEHDTGESCIGAVGINCNGESYVSFKSQHFPWAMCYNGFVYYGLDKHERHIEEVDVLERPLDCMCESGE